MTTTKPTTKPDGETSDVLTFTFKFSDDKRRKYTISLEDLTRREQLETEEFFDRPLGECVESGWLFTSIKGLVWLAYLARKRTDENFTFDEALDTFDAQVDDKRPTEVSKETGNPG